MKLFKKISQMLLVLTLLVVMIPPSISIAADAPINMGTAEDFAILAGQTVTNTGTTTINGNVGISPGSAFTRGPAIINGTVHIDDAIAIQAKDDLTTAFKNAAERSPKITIPSELGGSTLKPGYYVSESGKFELTGTLTLDAEGDSNAVFVFVTSSTLITATSSQVKFINGADKSQVFWNVGSSATLGITSHFEGTIMAMESITLTTGATINGALLARNGAVTLDSNTINTVNLPLISIEKTADKSELNEGPDTVTYSYEVSNLGSNNLVDVIVTDDKISDVTYDSGDTNADKILQPSEVWTYMGSMMIDVTTTNVATVAAKANNVDVVDTDTLTVTVSDVEAEPTVTPEPETTVIPEPDAETTVEPEPETTVAPDAETTVEPEPTTTPEPEPETTVEPEAETTVAPEPETTVAPEPETTVAPEPETTVEPEAEPTTTPEPEPTTTPETDITVGGKLPNTSTPLYLYLTGGLGFALLGLMGLKFNSKG